MEIKRFEYDFSVCKVADYSKVNLESKFCFIGKTDEEKSLVCLTTQWNVTAAGKPFGFKAYWISP